jgi:BolA protein
MTPGDRQAAIEQRLRQALEPQSLRVEDESAQHAGHAGAASGGGHYHVHLVSARFVNLSRVARHRLVYDAVADLMPAEIHALAIVALTPDELNASS